ncbi:MAG: serine hydrolase [Acidobacteriota bacterium]|nr:serine hydrolase [Acidobacteriota bacterium]
MKLLALCLLAVAASQAQQAGDYGAVTRSLSSFIEHEMADNKLPAVSIALVDDRKIVWSRAFGTAGPDSVFRVGSVSKLFTDLAIMQLVERGELDLDRPVTDYVPEFHPRNPYGLPVTLRELMSHRSGLQREPPVGHYFDASSPSLKATVESLNRTDLIYAPGARTKYSNAGIAVAGYLLERLKGQPFAEYLKNTALTPWGLAHSAFKPEPAIAHNLAKAFLWTYDGRTFDAPTFQLGIAPAGSLYATATDLAAFVSALFVPGRIVRRETLEQMWTPQFGQSGFGIGFRVSQLEGHRMVGHAGAIYGFATELAALPNEKLGAIAITTMDSANAVTGRIATAALRLMLAARSGRPLPVIPVTHAIAPERSRQLDGRYPGFEVTERNGELFALREEGGSQLRLRELNGELVSDDRLGFGTRFTAQDKLPDVKPAPTPADWAGLIGEYGWDHNVLYILERGRKLTALIEWYEYDPLEPVSANVFRFPDRGLYDHETLTFTRDAKGRATQVSLSGVVFPRRKVSPDDGSTFRITPLRRVSELEREALAATPPRETGEFRQPDLIEIAKLDPTIRLDIRYATTNNFMSTVFYAQPRAFMQRPAAEAVVRAHRKLNTLGLGLLIHDAYRPWYVTKMFWDATPDDEKIFVADPKQGSRHNRGCAVDLTICDLKTGAPPEMTGGYDEFSDRSYPDYPGGTSLERWNRKLLRRAMEEQGFTVYDAEWWHFDYKDWHQYPVLNKILYNEK